MGKRKAREPVGAERSVKLEDVKKEEDQPDENDESLVPYEVERLKM